MNGNEVENEDENESHLKMFAVYKYFSYLQPDLILDTVCSNPLKWVKWIGVFRFSLILISEQMKWNEFLENRIQFNVASIAKSKCVEMKILVCYELISASNWRFLNIERERISWCYHIFDWIFPKVYRQLTLHITIDVSFVLRIGAIFLLFFVSFFGCSLKCETNAPQWIIRPIILKHHLIKSMVVFFVCQSCNPPNSCKQTMIKVIQYSFSEIIIMPKHWPNQYLLSAPEAMCVSKERKKNKIWAISTKNGNNIIDAVKSKGQAIVNTCAFVWMRFFHSLYFARSCQNQTVQGRVCFIIRLLHTNKTAALASNEKKGIKQAQIHAKNV